jgi:FAD/FMN-containing dehydrogenase/catechol 2,3-dioxygenase-like lactoylglutathione lyase family enzyme
VHAWTPTAASPLANYGWKADSPDGGGPLHPARAPRLGHVALAARRPIELAGFYRELLGLELVRTTEHEHGGTMALLSGAPREEDHELVFLTRPEGAHVALQVRSVADLASLRDRLREHDVPIIQALDLGHALSLFIRDPEGNIVELYCATGRARREQATELDLVREVSRERLARRLTGELLRPEEHDYEQARQVFNAAVERRPALVVRCRTADDVAAAIELAAAEGLPVCVKAGGHSLAGFGVADGALMVDLSQMRGVRVDADGRTARVQGGATWRDVEVAASPCGLAASAGAIDRTGVAGVTLGGGYGWLHRRVGLACDNLISAEVVLADGSIVRAGADEHPELFFALRGGGGNFGVVTELELRLHPLGEVLAGFVLHPAARAADVLCLYRELCRQAPDELTLAVALITLPPLPFFPTELHGKQAVMLRSGFLGPTWDGERLLASVREYGPPVVDTIAPVDASALQRAASETIPPRAHVAATGEWFGELDDATIDALVEAHREASSPLSAIVLVQMGGAVTRVSEGETAFTFRHAAHALEVLPSWAEREDPAPHLQWMREVRAAVSSSSLGAGYVNFLGEEGQERIRAAYGRDTYQRLAAIKRAVDPSNRFRFNQNIVPAGAPAIAAAATE